jgi:hypothetical protein
MTRIEKRKMERFSLKLPAKLAWTGKDNKPEHLEQVTSNICAGGAFFETQKPLSVGTDVKINIILPLEKFKNLKLKRSHIRVSGSVIRTDQQGMAVCFDKKFHIVPNNIALS